MAIYPTPTEARTWNGKTQYNLTVSAGEARQLYIVKFRATRVESAKDYDDISMADRFNGAMTFKGFDDKIYRQHDGHDAGSLHTISAQAVLTWKLSPGDVILHVLTVRFSGTRTLTWDPEYSDTTPCNQWTRWVKATCDPVENGVVIACDSTPGRGAMLGEDGLEDAYGNDVLTDCLHAALEDDFRPSLCSLRYAAEPDYTNNDEWDAWYKARKVSAEIKAEAMGE